MRAVALRLQLLLFDEPTSSRDPEVVDEVLFLDGVVIVERGTLERLFTAPHFSQ